MLDDKRYLEIEGLLQDIDYIGIITFKPGNKIETIEKEIKDALLKYAENGTFAGENIYEKELELSYTFNMALLLREIKYIFRKTLLQYINAGKLENISISGKTMDHIINDVVVPETLKNGYKLTEKIKLPYLPEETEDMDQDYNINRKLREDPLIINIENLKLNLDSNKRLNAKFKLKLIPMYMDSAYFEYSEEPFIDHASALFRNALEVDKDIPDNILYAGIAISGISSKI